MSLTRPYHSIGPVGILYARSRIPGRLSEICLLSLKNSVCLVVIRETGTIKVGGVCLACAHHILLLSGYNLDYAEVFALTQIPNGLNAPPVFQMRLTTRSPEETIALGRRLGQAINANLFIALSGGLGAGKTTFTKGLAAGLGLAETVTSPTFTLINDYGRGRGSQARRLVHMDVYRLEGGSGAELDGIGYGDLLDELDEGGRGLLVLVVEWADRLGDSLPDDRLEISSAGEEDDPDARTFSLIARGAGPAALLQRLGDGPQ